MAGRSAAGISRVWQGKDFSAAGTGSAGHGTATKGKDFSADRHSSAGHGRAGQPEARILAMNGNAMQGNACLGDANKAKARIFNLRGVNK